MNLDNKEITLLTKDQLLGKNEINVIEEVGLKCAITDFAFVLGECFLPNILLSPTGWYYLSSSDSMGNAYYVKPDGEVTTVFSGTRYSGVRPVIPFDDISSFSSNLVGVSKGVFEIEYGEYPQYVVSIDIEKELNRAYSLGLLRATEKKYTTDSRKYDDIFSPFKAIKHKEYEYNGKKYVRVCYRDKFSSTLSNNQIYKEGDYVWIEISPLIWYVDSKAKLLLSKNIVASGIRFCDNGTYKGDFKTTEMYQFLNTYFKKDIIPSVVKEMTDEENDKVGNPYNLSFRKVSEEDIIKGSIESGVAVFLHGASSEGKSARVKEIDPNCITIYLRNATPESLNGKSVYNSETGEMIDVKPTWLKKLEDICEKEPDKLHIVFFDEITNALPSIQGIAFNIVLDREVNGMWQLPENARIVAAGNEMKDSLSANQLAEPLFNRFAHVYIKTTPEGWLKWASENNIHPAIYSYIAYKKGETLRSEYNGEKPNADPRKWEMASKMLYKTNSPEMLRALVGEDITREFVEFCNQKVITLNDVINKNYTEEDIKKLNISSIYLTTSGLTIVDEEHFEIVREFIETNFGKEFTSLFDTLWSRNDIKRLELIGEIRQSKVKKIGVR